MKPGDCWSLSSLDDLPELRPVAGNVRGHRFADSVWSSREDCAAEQGDEADERGASDGRSQLIPGVGRTRRRALRVAVHGLRSSR